MVQKKFSELELTAMLLDKDVRALQDDETGTITPFPSLYGQPHV